MNSDNGKKSNTFNWKGVKDLIKEESIFSYLLYNYSENVYRGMGRRKTNITCNS
jgi:hypothetical protein